MTHGDMYCHHEALNGCLSREEFTQRMNLRWYSRAGNSDSGLVISDWQARFSDPPTLVIERPADQVLASLVGSGIVPDQADCVIQAKAMLEFIQTRLDALKGNILRVRFEDIDRRLDEIHWFLVNRPVDQDRVRLFSNLRIAPVKVVGDRKSFNLWMG